MRRKPGEPPYESATVRGEELADQYMREWCYPGGHDMALKAHLINLATLAIQEGEAYVRWLHAQQKGKKDATPKSQTV
jgi:hypothetical protein